MSEYLSTIEMAKENMQFTAGHVTIFSATERERMHGHQYSVYIALTAIIKHNGMAFDYRYYKKKVAALCEILNQRFLMPQYSPYMTMEEDETYYYFTFNHKKMVLLKEDVTVLPLANITTEELSRWFVLELTKDKATLDKHHIQKLLVKVSTSHIQSASHEWCR